MPDILTPDLCVVGAGSGGLSVAAAAALFGVPVVLVEAGEMGGDCLNVGCVPSKALIAAGDLAHRMGQAVAFGLEPVSAKADFAAVSAHVKGVIAAIAPNDSEARFAALGVRVVRARAAFTDAKTLVAGDVTIRARRFVLATGSRPAAPPIPGLDSVPYLTNETVFDLETRPRKLLVIGGGAIGLELAQGHRRLGSDVTVLEAGTALGRDDPEMAACVLAALAGEGITIREGVKIARVEPAKSGVRIVLADGETLDGTHLLVAAGRKATIDDLGLDAAGIRADKSGILVDRGLRTSNRRVYAIGDCASGPHVRYRFTHVANYHAGLVIRSALFRLPIKADESAIPRVTYTDPEIAAVGLDEVEARKKHRHIHVLRWPFAENDRAQTERRTDGHVKVVTDRKGRVLGASIVGAQAGDLILPWIMAVAGRLSVSAFTGLVFPYPTRSEATKRAAISFYAPSASNPWVRRLIRWLRVFG